MSPQTTRRRVLRRVVAPAAAVALALGLTVALTTTTNNPAAASGSYTGRAYVYGENSLNGDLDDEGVVNVATHRSSNVTCMWQTFLWADGYLPASGVDGIFGDQTHTATVKWQRAHGLVGDGSVGRQTFAKAGQKVGSGDVYDGYKYGTYNGANRGVVVRRPDGTGNWMFVPPSGSFISAAYNWNVC